jgi:prevent-host-death family protein
MKKVSVEQLSKETPALVSIAQSERVVITSNGKPSAVLLGIENKDEEDHALERDDVFWKMIRARRKQKTIPLAVAKVKLGLTKSAKKVRGSGG